MMICHFTEKNFVASSRQKYLVLFTKLRRRAREQSGESYVQLSGPDPPRTRNVTVWPESGHTVTLRVHSPHATGSSNSSERPWHAARYSGMCQHMSVHVNTCQCMSARVSVSKYVLLRVSTFQYLFICSFINLKMHFITIKTRASRRKSTHVTRKRVARA